MKNFKTPNFSQTWCIYKYPSNRNPNAKQKNVTITHLKSQQVYHLHSQCIKIYLSDARAKRYCEQRSNCYVSAKVISKIIEICGKLRSRWNSTVDYLLNWCQLLGEASLHISTHIMSISVVLIPWLCISDCLFDLQLPCTIIYNNYYK